MLRRLHPNQPDSFAFTPDNQKWAEGQIKKYPEGRQASAIIPLLWRAQEQEGWLTRPALESVADMLGMPYIRALEVASFYFMFQLQPVGSVAHIQICGTTSCMICGAEDLIGVCREKIADAPHQLSADGKFSWEEVECLGACANAPMAQIGKDYYEDLTTEKLAEIIDELAAGRVPVPGPQNGRYTSEPAGGLTSLTKFDSGRTAYNGSAQRAVDIGDTVKRIDGTEVPLLTPWVDKGAMHNPAPFKGKAPKAAPSADAKTQAKPAAKEAQGSKPAAKADSKSAASKATSAKSGDKAQSPSTKTATTKTATTKTAATKPAAKKPTTAPDAQSKTAKAQTGAGRRPKALTAARKGGADDLKLIKGVGPKLEELLHRLGFFHFDQVAKWNAEEVSWVDQNLEGFKGRVTRDDWVAQAKILADGKETAFSARKKGK